MHCVEELLGTEQNLESMLSRDFPTFSKSQFRHAMVSHNIGNPDREGEIPMDNNKRDAFHVFGNPASPNSEGIPKKCSNALATTLSSCQVPGSKLAGGTSLLVASVLGKNLQKPKQPIRGSVKRKPVDRRKESNDNEPNPNGKGRSGPLALMPPPRSMSINGPHINLNSPFVGANMTYLFDKVASVTDCRSTGHFVLPKRKVEEHFPPINKPGGIWMKLLDNKGKEWCFEFCFWHSKDSRIYYFKKFYPFVQSENLVGGDTVFFSRLEPEGTLYMSVKDRVQKSPQMKQSKQIKASTGGASKDRFKEREHSNGGIRYLANDWSPSLEDEVAPRQGNADKAYMERALDRGTQSKRRRKNEFPRMAHTSRSNFIEYLGVDEVTKEKRLAGRRSISLDDFQHVDRIGGVLGSKRKRLQINVDEYSEWMDMQELLQPAPGVIPTVVTIDGHDFEEYKEPPVLTKRPTYSPKKTYGPEHQWVKCIDCGSWRRLPSDAFIVPSVWVCADNDQDLERARCDAPQELSDFEVRRILGISSDAEDEEVQEERCGVDEGDEEEYNQPQAVWSATRTLMDGFQHRNFVQPETENCISYTSGIETFNGVGNTFCEPDEEPTPFTGRSEFLVSGARKDSDASTNCYDFLGLGAAEKNYQVSTTETKGGQFFGLADTVERENW